jgi:hypothetical protein
MADDDATDGADASDKDEAPRDRDLHETVRQRIEAMIPDLVRRTFSAGLGAVASTEDGLRRLTKELQIPNVAGYLADTADNTKDKVLEVVAREVRDFLSHVNLSDEIARMLTTLSLEVKTEIRFIPNSERYTGVDPDVKAAVRLKRTDGKDDAAGKAPAKDKPDSGKIETRPDPRPEPRADNRSEGRARVSRLRRLWRRATDPLDLIPDDDDATP